MILMFSPWGIPPDMFFFFFRACPFLINIQCGAPKIAKWFITLITRTYGRYNIYLVNGIINQLITGGHHLVAIENGHV